MESSQFNLLREEEKLAFEVLHELDPGYTLQTFLKDRTRIRKVLEDETGRNDTGEVFL
jgi:hypothetical protein